MAERLIMLVSIVSVAVLGLWQISRQEWAFALLDLALLAITIWIYIESVITAIRQGPVLEKPKDGGN